MPLDLPRLVMRRAGLVVPLVLLLALVLGLLRMRDDVDDELRGANTVAAFVAAVSTLPQRNDAEALMALREALSTGELRHLRVQVVDAAGMVRLRVAPAPEGDAAGLAALGAMLPDGWLPMRTHAPVSWPLARPEGPPWVLMLTADADSERREAWLSLIDQLVLLSLLAAGLLALMAWNTRRAFRPLAGMLKAIRSTEAGDRSALAELPAMPVNELESIAAALRHLAAALDAAEAERRVLGQKVLTLQEDERQRLAAELHDELGQRLTALRVDAAWLERRLATDADALSVVRTMAAQCERLQHDVRDMLRRLRPLGPAALGQAPETAASLCSLLHGLADSWNRSGSMVCRCEVQVDGDAGLPVAAGPDAAAALAAIEMPRAALLALYRLSQEALTNAARHAQAVEVELKVHWTPAVDGRPARLRWTVQDDGIGLPGPDAQARGSGIAGMRERAWTLGCDLAFEPVDASAARPGTRLRLELALAAEHEQGRAS